MKICKAYFQRSFRIRNYKPQFIISNSSFTPMKIIVKTKPGAKEDKIEKVDEANYVISVKEPPINGRANASLIKLLAEYFDISPSLIEIISGYMARVKVIEINN